MEYQEFLCVVEKKMNQKLKGGITASIHIAVKNNGKIKRGILVEDPSVNISPTIYLEDFYERFQKGESLEEITDTLMDFYEAVRYEKSWDTTRMESYEGIKDQIVFKLIYRNRNQELLSAVPHFDLLDLSIVFYVLLEVKQEGTATMLIRKEHLKKWGIGDKELFSTACANSVHLLPAQLYTMKEIVGEVFEPDKKTGESHNLLKYPEQKKRDVMFVLTNTIRSFGAACMMYPGILETIGKMLGEDYYILPSSIHEVIIVPKSQGFTQKEMTKMVQEVNTTQVEDEEQLSDHAYYYDRKKKQLIGE